MLLALRKVTLPGLIVVGVILKFLKFLCLLITHLRLSHFRIFLEKFNPLWIVTPCLSWQIIHFRNKDDKNEIANRAKHKVLSCNIYVEPQNLKEYKINTHTHTKELYGTLCKIDQIIRPLVRIKLRAKSKFTLPHHQINTLSPCYHFKAKFTLSPCHHFKAKFPKFHNIVLFWPLPLPYFKNLTEKLCLSLNNSTILYN